MKIPTSLSALIALAFIYGCSSNASLPKTVADPANPFVSQISLESGYKTVLLVSLEDGTVIKQMIDVAAEICFKQAANTATTCLTEGAPIVDAQTDTVIGIEMIEKHIDLVGKPGR